MSITVLALDGGYFTRDAPARPAPFDAFAAAAPAVFDSPDEGG